MTALNPVGNRGRRVLAAWAVALAGVASAAPGPSTQPGGGAPPCRTGLATYRIVTKSAAFTSTVNGRCTFNPASNEGTCTNDYSDTMGTTFTSVSVTGHATKGDVVDEVSVIPPLNRSLGTTTTVTGGRLNSTSTSTHAYDGQKRLTSTASVSRPAGQTSTTTYTAWDSAGRPRAARQGSGGSSTTQSFSYDTATRTQTSTNAGMTCTQTFDANGNPVLGTCPGSAATTTILSTQQICR